MTIVVKITILLAAPALLFGCRRPATVSTPDAPPAGEVWISKEQMDLAQIEVSALGDHEVDDTLAASGRVTFDDLKVAHVFSPVTGKVTRIDAKAGQRVKKDDVLAVIVSPDIGQASSDLAKAEADVIAAQHDLKRKKELYEDHAASAADVEASEDNYRTTRAEKERALQKARLLRGGSAALITQGYPLSSPLDGEVIARAVNPGVEVQGQYGGGTPVELFTVGELDSVWVLADVFEMDLPRIQVGSKVSVTVGSFPDRKFVGAVDWVSGAIDPSMRTAKVRCVLPNADRALRPEMYVTVNVAVGQERALAVPRSAVLRLEEHTVVFVENGTTPNGLVRFKKAQVVIDEAPGTAWIPLVQGPARGTRVVTAGAIMLVGML